MKKFEKLLSFDEIINLVDGKLIKREAQKFSNVAELTEADANSICFYEDKKYEKQLKESKAGLILVKDSFNINKKPKTNLIIVKKPYLAFTTIVKYWYKKNEQQQQSKIDDSACLPENIKLGENIIIKENVVIGRNVTIGDNTFIDSNCVIKKNVQIGKNCHIHPNTTIYEDSIIHDNVILHSGCVIGADGFGYHFIAGKQEKILQIGNVILEDDVEIGANSTIDRATLGSTVIGKGSKLDNLVQIGHNCRIGKNSIICAQVGLAGSTIVGDRVFLAGQVGVAGHLTINDDVKIGAQSGITKSIPEGEKFFGTPAIKATDQKRLIVYKHKLPEIYKRLKKLEKENR